MTTEQIDNKVIELASIAYKVPADEITRESHIVKDLKGKSMTAFKYIYLLQSEYGIKVPAARAMKNETIGDVCDMVAELLAEAG